jgi:hypothetical protein
VLEDIWNMLAQGGHGAAQLKEQSPTTLVVAVDELFVIRFRVDETKLYLGFEQKLLVPSHMYNQYRQRLGRLAEDITRLVKPTSLQCGLKISFENGAKNPYYGVFVSRVPPELLQDFQVAFRLAARSSCRVEAGKDHVNIESTSLSELFDALSEVLSLKALPVEGHL